MLTAQPVTWIRDASLLGLLFAIAFVTGVAEVVSWSFIPRDRLGLLRFVPFALLVGPLIGAMAFSGPMARLVGLAAQRNWPLSCLWGAMAIGGLWTRFATGSHESFFGHALAMTTFFAAWSFATRVGPAACAIPLLRAIAPFWFVMLAVVCYGFATHQHLAHEIMYVFAPLPLFIGLSTRSEAVRAAAVLGMVAMAALGLKNTTLIIASLSVYFLWIFGQTSVRGGERRPFNLRALALFAVVGAVAYWGWSQLSAHVEDFSSGNTDFRKYNYARLWHMFLASPIWGDRFIGSPNLEFDLFEVDVGNQVLPSHSDALDVLAHGGVIGFALLLAFVAGFVRNFLLTCQPEGDREEYAARVTLFAMSVGGLFTTCFNPVWANTTNSFMFWSLLGLCAAVCNPHRDHVRGRWWRGSVPDEPAPPPTLAAA
jgi:hypothetical protein